MDTGSRRKQKQKPTYKITAEEEWKLSVNADIPPKNQKAVNTVRKLLDHSIS